MAKATVSSSSAAAAGKGGGDDGPPSSLSSKILLPAILIPIVIVPLLSSLVNYIWSTPPTDFGTGSMFDSIAPRYDFINRALALNMDKGWRRRMIRDVTDGGELFRRDVKGGAKILDLATGTADVAILLAEAAAEAESSEAEGAPTTILGIDPSANMIDVGRQKVSSKSMSEVITLQIGDARKLEGLKDSTFDAATMSFGIRNVPSDERDDALCEIHRVLKKGKRGVSKLGILEFSEPESGSGVLGSAARLFIRHVVPVLGALLSGAPREYMHLQNSIKEFPSPGEFKELMEGLECGKGGKKGTFVVEDVVQMNFGSVQLYLAKPVMR